MGLFHHRHVQDSCPVRQDSTIASNAGAELLPPDRQQLRDLRQQRNQCSERGIVSNGSVIIPTDNSWSKPSFDETISRNFQFTDQNYDKALAKAAREGKPVVAIFGSQNMRDSQQLIERTLPAAGRQNDAVFVFVDTERARTNPQFSSLITNEVGPTNLAHSRVFSLTPDANGKPVPDRPLLTTWGGREEIAGLLQSHIGYGLNNMRGKQFAAEETPPPLPEPPQLLDVPAPPLPEPPQLLDVPAPPLPEPPQLLDVPAPPLPEPPQLLDVPAPPLPELPPQLLDVPLPPLPEPPLPDALSVPPLNGLFPPHRNEIAPVPQPPAPLQLEYLPDEKVSNEGNAPRPNFQTPDVQKDAVPIRQDSQERNFEPPLAQPEVGRVNELDPRDFDRLVRNSDKPVIVDVYGTKCGFCTKLEPTMARIAQKHGADVTVYRMNAARIEENPDLARRLDVSRVPAVFMFDRGHQVSSDVGANSQHFYESRIKKLTTSHDREERRERITGETGNDKPLSLRERRMEHLKNKLERLTHFTARERQQAFQPSADELRTLDLINQYRRSKGCAEVVQDPRLQMIANRHTDYQSRFGMTHNEHLPGWQNVSQRMQQVGLEGWRENAGTGNCTPENLVQLWIRSPLHRAALVGQGNIAAVAIRNGKATFNLTNDPELESY